MFTHDEAFSFQVATADQAETDRYWNAIVGNGGQASACGWCKDRWGLSWQITPTVLTDGMGDPDPAVRQRAVAMWIRLHLMRLNALRVMSSGPDTPPAAMITKLYWATLHRDMGELAMDVLGPDAMIRTGELRDGEPDYSALQRLFLFSRSDTIYGGSNQVQRNIIGERALGLPKEPK